VEVVDEKLDLLLSFGLRRIGGGVKFSSSL
jgi:hypothetical protein